MPKKTPTKREEQNIDRLVQHFVENQEAFNRLVETLVINITKYQKLFRHVHSIKWRVKDPTHLKDKLIRKLKEAKAAGNAFDITPENLFTRINDLAGFRILHLHTKQIENINAALLDLFDEQRYRLIEGPSARTWDDESRDYFNSLKIKTVDSETMYTSVHYVIEPNTRTALTCEIQVRTLAEELWGEVDHKINYPYATENVSCSEQIKVLARVTSSCSRLVDSIFATHEVPYPTPKQAGKKRARARKK